MLIWRDGKLRLAPGIPINPAAAALANRYVPEILAMLRRGVVPGEKPEELEDRPFKEAYDRMIANQELERAKLEACIVGPGDMAALEQALLDVPL